MVSEINHDIHLLRLWFADHKLVVSNKTKLIMFNNDSYGQNDIKVSFYAPVCSCFKLFNSNCLLANSITSYNSHETCCNSCFNIEIVKDFKYLGVILDQHLNWSEHITHLKQYLPSTVRCFYQLKKYCSLSTLKKVYYGIFNSKIQYDVTCWGGAYLNKIQQIAVIQKCVLRKICNSARLAHSADLFRQTGILPVRHLFYFKVLKIFFMRGGYLESPIRNSYNTRNANLLRSISYRTTRFRNLYTIVSCKLYNSLPADVEPNCYY